MYVHFIVNHAVSNDSISLPPTFRRTWPNRIEYAGQRLRVTQYRTDKFVNLSTVPEGSNGDIVCQVGESLRRRLRLPKQAKLRCRVAGDTWTLGPCVAVYLDAYPPNRPFGEQTQLLTNLAERAQDMGIDLVVLTPRLTPEGIGYRYDAAGRTWGIEPVPEPDVVFRRSGAFRRRFETTAMSDLASYTAAGRLHTLPRNYSNKWNMYQMLQHHSQVAPYLPRTTLAKSAEDVFEEALRRKDVYVKPLTGAKGTSVYHLFTSRDVLVVAWDDSGARPGRKLPRRTFGTSEDFCKFWRGLSLKQVVVQDTVLLPRTDEGRPFDFRWLIQYNDKPVVVARVGRMGQQGAVTTNIHSGGKPYDAASLLKRLKWKPKRIRELLERMDELAINTAEALRDEFGPYAELGIDLAVSKDGAIRLFEVNSTPGRKMLRQLDVRLRQLSLDYLLEYAIKAAGFAAD